MFRMTFRGIFLVAIAAAGTFAYDLAAAFQDSPKPTKQHEGLKAAVGTWDGDAMLHLPGTPPVKSKGVETNIMVGDFWLLTHYEGESMPGVPFEGYGILGYDTGRERYVGI